MTTYITKTGTTAYNKAKFKPHDRMRLRVASCQHNAAATAIPADNVVNIITIPADSILMGATVDVSTVQANTDIKLGCLGDDDALSASTDLATAGTTILPSTIGTAQGQPIYSNNAHNVIVTAVTNAINAAIFTVRVVYMEMDAQTSIN